MITITEKQRKFFEFSITEIMETAVSGTYANCILESRDSKSGNTLMEDVIQNILNAQGGATYLNYSNIRLAIGNELSKRLNNNK